MSMGFVGGDLGCLWGPGEDLYLPETKIDELESTNSAKQRQGVRSGAAIDVPAMASAGSEHMRQLASHRTFSRSLPYVRQMGRACGAQTASRRKVSGRSLWRDKRGKACDRDYTRQCEPCFALRLIKYAAAAPLFLARTLRPAAGASRTAYTASLQCRAGAGEVDGCAESGYRGGCKNPPGGIRRQSGLARAVTARARITRFAMIGVSHLWRV